MYCSKCGKKVGDTMLFCPFCGEAIVIPDQDEQEKTPDQWNPALEEKQTTVEEFEPLLKQTEVDSEKESKEEKTDAGDATKELLQWNSERREAVDEWARRDEPAEPFEPLKLEEEAEVTEDWRYEISKKKESAQPEKQPPKIHHHGDAEPVRLDGAAPIIVDKEAFAAVKKVEIDSNRRTEIRAKARQHPRAAQEHEPQRYVHGREDRRLRRKLRRL